MTCKNCIMFTHCRYDIDRNGEICEHFIGKRQDEAELWGDYLKRGFDDLMSFSEYKNRCNGDGKGDSE